MSYTDTDLQMQSKVVLCVEEYDVPEIGRRKYNIDTRMFVYYDNENGVFRIFGKRQEVKTQMSTFVPYAFQTENIGAVQNFIKLTIDPETKVSVTLFNFNDLYDTERTGNGERVFQTLAGMDKSSSSRMFLVKSLIDWTEIYFSVAIRSS